MEGMTGNVSTAVVKSLELKLPTTTLFPVLKEALPNGRIL